MQTQNQNGNIDPYGHCPCCKESWQGSIIPEALASLEVLSRGVIKTDSSLIGKLAATYGWTPENDKRFSNTIFIRLCLPKGTTFNTDYIQCQNPICMKIFDIATGAQYDSIYLLRQHITQLTTPAEVSVD